jgi:hypothetical protein
VTAVPFPDASLGLNQYTFFGSGNGKGSATVYRYEIRHNYNGTSPFWKSPREQVAASQPLKLQNGFTMERPKEENTFLIIFVRVEDTRTKAVYAPSAKQFVMYSDGKITMIHPSIIPMWSLTT